MRRTLAACSSSAVGRIVNVASIAGKGSNRTLVPYPAAKAGVVSRAQALAAEIATRNIAGNAVAPAVIGTELLKQMTKETADRFIAAIPMGWFSTGAIDDLSGGWATA